VYKKAEIIMCQGEITMKKTGLGILVALLLILSACSSNSAPNASSGTNNKAVDADAATVNSDEKVTLTYAIWEKNFQPAFEAAIKAFETAHPNVKINIELTPYEQYWTKLDTAATGGSLTDLFWMNGPNSYKYASNDILMPITDELKDELGNYPEGLLSPYVWEDNTYGIPFEFATVGLWYNKKLFKEANIPFPDASWDWNTVKDAAKKLTDSSKGVWGIAAFNNNFQNFYNTVVQNNGYIISEDKKSSGYDKPEAIEGLKFWIDMIKDGVSPTAAQMTETQPQKMFESGKIAMLYDGSWAVGEFANNPYTKENADVAPLPKGKTATGVIHGTATVINAKTKHPQEAVELLKFLASKEANMMYADVGSFVPSYNGTQEKWVKSVPNFNLQSFVDSIDTATPYPISKSTAKWEDVQNEYFQKAWAGEMTIEEAAKQVAAKMNETLAAE
jgi:multiple sugar transport system substrate-binding protein